MYLVVWSVITGEEVGIFQENPKKAGSYTPGGSTILKNALKCENGQRAGGDFAKTDIYW